MGIFGMIDPTISVGALLNAAVLFVGFVVAFTRIGGRIDLLSQRLTSVEEILNRQVDITTRVAITETRQATHGQMIATMQQDIRDLKYGRGFVKGRPPEDGVEGEYP